MISPLLLGAVYGVLGIPLALGKVRPNSFYGFRVSKTLNDEAIWYKVNTFTGRAFIWCGAVTVLLAVGVMALGRALGLDRSGLAWLSLAIELVPLAVVVVVCSVFCYRA